MQQLFKHADSVVNTLSHTPLFLTVLCFTYVNYLRSNKDPRVMWQQGQYELIETCLRLLITDIDQGKARGLSPVKQRAMMNRRASYVDEKVSFLQFLAAQTYMQGVSVMNELWMTSVAKMFFGNGSQSQNANEIRRGLDFDEPSTNLVIQLILSGVFTTSGRTADGPIYDFPHRRFREKLATDYFFREEGRKSLFKHIGDPRFSEVVLVFADRFAVEAGLIDALIDRICQLGDDGSVGRLLGTCLTKLGSEATANSVVHRLLATLANLSTRPKPLRLPEELYVRYLSASDSNVGQLTVSIERSIDHSDPWLFMLSFPVLRFLAKHVAQRTLRDAIQRTHLEDALILPILAFAVGEEEHSFLELALHRLWPLRNVSDLKSTHTASVARVLIIDQALKVRRKVLRTVNSYFAKAEFKNPETAAFLRILQSYGPRKSTAVKNEAPIEWQVDVSLPIIWVK